MCSRGALAVVGSLWLWLFAGSGVAQEPDVGARVEVRIARAFPPGREERVIELPARGDDRRAAVDALSIVARSHAMEIPSAEDVAAYRENGGDEGFVVAGIKRLDARLLDRLERIAERFVGRRIEIVSGYRARARRTSRHRHGQALDIRIEGVPKEELVAFLRTLPETGVGFYPNSDLTHVDVREESYYWVDRSGPGERANYGERTTDAAAAGTAEAAEAPEAPEAPEEDAEDGEDAEDAEDAQDAEAPADAEDAEEHEPPMTDEEYLALRRSIREALLALR